MRESWDSLNRRKFNVNHTSARRRLESWTPTGSGQTGHKSNWHEVCRWAPKMAEASFEKPIVSRSRQSFICKLYHIQTLEYKRICDSVSHFLFICFKFSLSLSFPLSFFLSFLNIVSLKYLRRIQIVKRIMLKSFKLT